MESIEGKQTTPGSCESLPDWFLKLALGFWLLVFIGIGYLGVHAATSAGRAEEYLRTGTKCVITGTTAAGVDLDAAAELLRMDRIGDSIGIEQMVASGKAILVEAGAKGLVIDYRVNGIAGFIRTFLAAYHLADRSHVYQRRVRLEDTANRGAAVWLYDKDLERIY